jgi:hypothetical protein
MKYYLLLAAIFGWLITPIITVSAHVADAYPETVESTMKPKTMRMLMGMSITNMVRKLIIMRTMVMMPIKNKMITMVMGMARQNLRKVMKKVKMNMENMRKVKLK